MKTVTLKCIQEFYDNGQIKSERYYRDGDYYNPNGMIIKTWYMDGQIHSEESHLYNQQNIKMGVIYKAWYEDGTIESELYYLDGKRITKENIKIIQTIAI